MPDRAAFLRGVNLGRNRRVSSEELREIFEGAGMEDVGTFRTSGNVVFSGGGAARTLTSRLEGALEKSLGYEVTVFTRTADEVVAIASERPFPAKAVKASAGKLQIVLLGSKPAKAAREKVLAMATDADRLAFGDRELYWLPQGGTRDSTLDLRGIDAAIGPTTQRTMGTIEALVAKYFSD
jgi:uncharacterized protein (DUF1697 family)